MCFMGKTRSYDDQQGITHYVTELVVEEFEFLESKAAVQQREQKQHGAEPTTYEPPVEEPEMSQEQMYQQPPLNGISEHGFNQ